MKNMLLTTCIRTRSTPFSARVAAADAKSYTTYNHMLLPTCFDSPENDYHHLKKHVQVWDVSCERQVEIVGKDAARLMQLITPRDLSKLSIGQCYYVPVVDDSGKMLNDPVALKLAEDRFWVSLADSDLLLWIKAYALGREFDVRVFEPDVSPLAVQGPKSDKLMKRLFGDEIQELRFFRFKQFKFADTSFVIARSGYSKQGGFEIYVENAKYGEDIWDSLFSQGEDLNVRPGCPNVIERIESGLLSYGNDMTSDHTLYESGLGKFSQPDRVQECIGRDALLEQQSKAPDRQIRGLYIEGEPVSYCTEHWILSDSGNNGKFAGSVSSAAWSPDLKSNIAIGMIEKEYLNTTENLVVHTPDGDRLAKPCELPFPATY